MQQHTYWQKFVGQNEIRFGRNLKTKWVEIWAKLGHNFGKSD